MARFSCRFIKDVVGYLQLKLAETRGHLNKSNLSNLVLAGILMPSVVDLISHGRARNPLDDELKQDVWGAFFLSENLSLANRS